MFVVVAIVSTVCIHIKSMPRVRPCLLQDATPYAYACPIPTTLYSDRFAHCSFLTQVNIMNRCNLPQIVTMSVSA